MGKGHRKTRLSSRKNYERRKYKDKQCMVSIPCAKLYVLTVAIPQNDKTVASQMVVSLPITSFQQADVDGLETLRKRLVELDTLPTGNNCKKMN